MSPPLHHSRSSSSLSSVSSDPGERERHPLLPGAVPGRTASKGIFGAVRSDLIPFANVMQGVVGMLGLRKSNTVRTVNGDVVDVEAGGSDDVVGGIQRRWAEDDINGNPQSKPHYGVYPCHLSIDFA